MLTLSTRVENQRQDARRRLRFMALIKEIDALFGGDSAVRMS
ncbi:hypothetical protein [Nocardia sp. CA-119907]